MINYIAPNPYQEKSQGILSWLFSFSTPSSASIGRSIGQLVLPAQMRRTQELSQRHLNAMAVNLNLKIEIGCVGTHDEAVLDTIEMNPRKNEMYSMQEKRFIIKFNGNGGQYQDLLQEYGRDSQRLGMSVIGFNYRGVGSSTKKPDFFQNLITDGIAQVQRLLDEGANPEHILLDGHSLGGGIATMVAEHFHKRGQKLYLWNDRSFASISKAAAGIVAPNLPGVLSDTIESSFETSSWSVMKPSGWDSNIASAYNNIPEQYKNYMVVAKRSDKSSGDGVISHQASLHKGVRQEERKQGISTGNKVFSTGPYGGHNSARNRLFSKNNPDQNGQDLFEDFANRLSKQG